LLEGSGPLATSAREMVARLKLREDTMVTSVMTLGEILVKPLADNDIELIGKYRTFFDHPSLEVINFDQVSALEYAVIRQNPSIKAPDAIQLACAVSAKCDLFVTNDDRLSKKVVPGIQFIVSLDRVPI
jgi:predicted nucleic acid-binding protein